MSKATLIATLMAVVSAFSSPANAQAPLKTKPSAKSDQPTYMITAHTVVHDDSTIPRDNYVIVYGSEVLRVQYDSSQISTAKPGASQLEHEKSIQQHEWYVAGQPYGPDLSEVPQVGAPIRACEMEMDAAYPGGYRMAAIQSVSAPCMTRYVSVDGDILEYVLAPNGGIKMYDFLVFDILEETNNGGVVAAPSQIQLPPGYEDAKPIAGPLAQPSAQSAPPRKDIPAIAKAANDRGQAPAKISDAFAKAEVLALQAIEIAKEDSALVSRPDGSSVTRSEAALEVAKAEAVSSQEKLVSSLVEKIYEYKYISDYPLEVLEKSPSLQKDVNGFSSRINACISAEKAALRRRSAELPKVCNDEVISPPKTKEELAALQRKINAEVQAAERGAATVAANDPERQPLPQLTSPRRDIPAIAKSANGAIVSIIMSDKDGSPIAQGSGFLVSNDGVILTNYHVIAEGSSAVVKLPDGAFYAVDGVIASDKTRDVAVIKAHGQNFRTLTLGNSDQLQVGEEVVAIGNPLSLESTVSNGIVSGIRTDEKEGGKFLQVTTPISPGSSGGPLFNMSGEVVGITTMYLQGGENLNFAIPINDAKRLLLAESSIQALPNEPEPVQAGTPTEPAQAQTPDAAKALAWISSHMLAKALHTAPAPGSSGATIQMWETSSLSFQGCRVTIYDETTVFTVFRSGETYSSGINEFIWGPFDLSNLRPDKIFQVPDNFWHPPGAFLQIEAVSAIPTTLTSSSDGLPATKSMRAALHIWFESTDLVDRQVAPWHDAIVGCGGKTIPDDYTK